MKRKSKAEILSQWVGGGGGQGWGRWETKIVFLVYLIIDVGHKWV